MKNSEIQQLNRSETISLKMHDIAEKIGAQRPESYQGFTEVANEFATENYDKGQRMLEDKGDWSDELRSIASEANQASREKVGAKPLSFDDAKSAINGYAKNIADSGTPEDRKSAIMIESVVAGMSRPGQTGIDGIEDALKYIEGVLQTKSTSGRRFTPRIKNEWDEQRAARDALFAEKQKRMDKIKQAQRVDKGLINDHNQTNQTLEALYVSAEITEKVPSRQQLSQRVRNMSPEELYFFSAELNSIQKKFSETGNQKDLDANLFELTTKKFTKKDVEERTNRQDRQRLDEIRQSLDTKDPSRRQEKGHFYKALSSRELLNALNSPQNTYNKQKGAAVVAETFKKLYPDAKQFEHRLEILIKQYQTTIELSRKNNPQKSEEAHQAFAGKQVMEKISSQEKQTIEAFMEKNYQKLGGRGQIGVGSEYVFCDFLEFVTKFNN